MIKFFRKRMNKKGFTLVELLIVIAVLGIIAGIAVPSMSGVTDSFKFKADVETARIAAKQVEIYTMMGQFPKTSDSNSDPQKIDVSTASYTLDQYTYGEALPISQVSGESMEIIVKPGAKISDDMTVTINTKSGGTELFTGKVKGKIQ